MTSHVSISFAGIEKRIVYYSALHPLSHRNKIGEIWRSDFGRSAGTSPVKGWVGWEKLNLQSHLCIYISDTTTDYHWPFTSLKLSNLIIYSCGSSFILCLMYAVWIVYYSALHPLSHRNKIGEIWLPTPVHFVHSWYTDLDISYGYPTPQYSPNLILTLGAHQYVHHYQLQIQSPKPYPNDEGPSVCTSLSTSSPISQTLS